MARRGWNGERVFYTAMGCAILVTVFIGFAPTFYLRRVATPLPPLLLVHGVVFSSWILLFLVQTGLVAAGRTDLHRRVGVLGALLALAMVGLGTMTALRSIVGLSGLALESQLAFLAIPLFDMVVFAVLVGTAVARRRVPQAHKRLMLIAMISILSPATGRMPWPDALRGTVSDFVVPNLFLLPLVVGSNEAGKAPSDDGLRWPAADRQPGAADGNVRDRRLAALRDMGDRADRMRRRPQSTVTSVIF